eukprot:95554-Prymnesium_polylepis.1
MLARFFAFSGNFQSSLHLASSAFASCLILRLNGTLRNGAAGSAPIVNRKDWPQAAHAAAVRLRVLAADLDPPGLRRLLELLRLLRLQRGVDDNGAVRAFEGLSSSPCSSLGRLASCLACLSHERTRVAMVGS